MISLPINLTDGFSPFVSVNDTVKIGQIIAKQIVPKEKIINLAQAFSIPIKKVGKTLRKNPGDIVHIGDVLAIKRGIFSLHEERIESKVDGTVTKFDRGNGSIWIRTQNADGSRNEETDSEQITGEELLSPIEGTVTICDNEKIVIETDKNVIVGKRGIGESNLGEITLLSIADDTKRDDSLLFALDTQVIGKIIVSSHMTKEALMKSIGMGVRGIVSNNVTEDHFTYLSEKKLMTPVISVADADMSQLTMWKGKNIFLEGSSKSIILLHT